jgi:transcriptional regulator with GAF, ATPase, and Fis domain
VSTKGETRARRTLLFVRGGALTAPGAPPVAIGPDPVVVGRAPSCTIAVRDPEVSAIHCELRATPNGVVLRDLGSTNGTFVGNVAVREAYLAGACSIMVGRTLLVFEPETKKAFVDTGTAQGFGGLVGDSPMMRRIYQAIARIAPTELSVLVTGETGTGKELVARAVHEASARRARPFVVVDCGAIPASLAESTLFGHVRGSFTGASEDRSGAFAEAHGGTVFLDELGELPEDVQPKLLRVLAEGSVQPVGSNARKRVDLRVIAATRRDLREDVNTERFRSDLFFRIAQVTLELPPLRDRRQDIPLLLARAAERAGRAAAADRLVDLFASRFDRYDWPGNVRELTNMASVVLALDDGRSDDVFDMVLPSSVGTPRSPVATSIDLGFVDAKRAFEETYFRALREETRGNISAIARRCGLARHQVREHLRKLGLMPRAADPNEDD